MKHVWQAVWTYELEGEETDLFFSRNEAIAYAKDCLIDEGYGNNISVDEFVARTVETDEGIFNDCQVIGKNKKNVSKVVDVVAVPIFDSRNEVVPYYTGIVDEK